MEVRGQQVKTHAVFSFQKKSKRLEQTGEFAVFLRGHKLGIKAFDPGILQVFHEAIEGPLLHASFEDPATHDPGVEKGGSGIPGSLPQQEKADPAIIPLAVLEPGHVAEPIRRFHHILKP